MERIENLNPEQLAEALEYNGYGECVEPIRIKYIDGHAFLKLTEIQIALWCLPAIHRRRLWSFLLHIRENPHNFEIKPKKFLSKPPIGVKPSMVSTLDKEKTSSSSLSKQESVVLKNKLERTFKTSGTITNNSFLHKKQLPLPPKPQFDFNDEDYLPPIIFSDRDTSPKKTTNTSAFLNKTRETYQHVQLDIKPRRNPLIRPLPSIPIKENDQQEIYTPVEDESEYSPVLEDETGEAQYIAVVEDLGQVQVGRNASTLRPLPPIPFQQTNYETDEQLADYGVIEEDNLHNDDSLQDYMPMLGNNQVKSNTNSRRRPLPSIPKKYQTARNASNKKYNSSDSEDDAILKGLKKTSKTSRSTTNSNTLPVPRKRSESTSPLQKPKSGTQVLLNRSESTSPLQKPKSGTQVPLNRSESTSPLQKPKSGTQVPLNRSESTLPLQNPKSGINTWNNNKKDTYDFRKEACYRETDRKGAKMLLKGLQNGTFLIRPSRDLKYVCTFSIMHTIKMLNYGVERDEKGFLSLTSAFVQPKFNTVGEMVTFYTAHPLLIVDENVTLKILPTNRR